MSGSHCRSSNLPKSFVGVVIIDRDSVKCVSDHTGCCDEGLIKHKEECNGIVRFHFNATFSTSLHVLYFYMTNTLRYKAITMLQYGKTWVKHYIFLYIILKNERKCFKLSVSSVGSLSKESCALIQCCCRDEEQKT